MLNDQKLVTSMFIPQMDLLMEMITKNIFRPLPCLKRNGISIGMSDTGVDNEEQESDPTWPHIRGVYEIFLQLIVNEACDVKTLKSYITTNFISEVSILIINLSFCNYLTQKKTKKEISLRISFISFMLS